MAPVLLASPEFACIPARIARGASTAVSLLVLVNLFCIPVVWFALPETRGVTLGGSPSETAA